MARNACQMRPRLVCVLADNSASMEGPKAKAATEGIREVLLQCQVVGPRGLDRSYFTFVLIKFGTTATLQYNMVPVRQIDADAIEIRGDGGEANIVGALEFAYGGLERYMREVVQPHPARAEYPLPLVLLFSDGHNGHGEPEPVARKIKNLTVDGESIVVGCAGVSTDSSDQPDEPLLRAIASPECYVHINDVRMLNRLLVRFDGSGAFSAREARQVIARLEEIRGGGSDHDGDCVRK